MHLLGPRPLSTGVRTGVRTGGWAPAHVGWQLFAKHASCPLRLVRLHIPAPKLPVMFKVNTFTPILFITN